MGVQANMQGFLYNIEDYGVYKDAKGKYYCRSPRGQRSKTYESYRDIKSAILLKEVSFVTDTQPQQRTVIFPNDFN